MKTKIGVIIILCLLAIFIGNIIQKTMDSEEIKGIEEEPTNVEKEKVAPNIVLQNLQGETVELADYKGKNVVLNFWTTWCPPCKEEMPHLQKYYDKYKDKQNVEVLGVNLTFADDSEKKVKQFVENYNLDFPILLTNDEKVEALYRIATIPSTFFLDTEGRINQKIVGQLDEKSLHFYVNELINK